MARRPRQFFKASPWELEDAEEENVEILINHAPKSFVVRDGKLAGMEFERLEWSEDAKGKQTSKVVETVFLPADDVVLAIGQENAFPWIERDIGIDFDQWDMPVVDKSSLEAKLPGVFFGGDAAFGPQNIIWAVAHGHQAAISIDLHCQEKSTSERPAESAELVSQKMGLHQWSYSNDFNPAKRAKMNHVELEARLRRIDVEVEKGFTPEQMEQEVQRCLNCDVQTVFTAPRCIECDACVDVCPLSCLTIATDAPEPQLRRRLTVPALNASQEVYASAPLPQSGRLMLKDEDLCVHCGLCAERCPTAAWDMQKFELHIPYAGKPACPPDPKE